MNYRPLTLCLLLFLLSVTVNAKEVNTTPNSPSIIDTLPSKEDKVFEKIEIEPSVNLEAWNTHLQTHLQKLLNKAARKRMPPGQYTVNVRFLVEKDGSISQATALNDPGYGIGEGAEKIVKTGPKWKAGQLGGRRVRSYHTQPLTFVISE